MLKRIERLLSELKNAGAEAALLHSPENIRYFSGFTGEGCVFIAPGTRAVLTDSRYTEQAQNQAPGFAVKEIGLDKFTDAIAALTRETGVKAVGYEDDWLPVLQYRKIAEALPGIETVPAAGIAVRIRMVKDAEEIRSLKRAGEITDGVFQYALSIAKPGMKEITLSAELKYYMAKQYLAQPAFEFIIASGENGSMPHAIPSERAIAKGDMVTLDFGAEYKGYRSDMTRTFAVGAPSARMAEIYGIVLAAHLRAAEYLKPGAECRAVDAVARDYIRECGYGANFGHGLGHGVGLQIHEQPNLNTRSEAILGPGMAVTNEPGIYLPGIGGVRIEDTCIITQSGFESIFVSDKNLIIL